MTGMLAAVRAADICTVVGEVADRATGQRLADVNVILTKMRTGVRRGMRTDAAGKYIFTTVFPAGQYKITVALQGYVAVELTDVWPAINDAQVVIPPRALERLTGPAATVTVEGKEAVVNTSDAAQRLTADELTVSTLPLSGGRTFDGLAFVAPAAAPVAQSAETGPGVGPGAGTAGQFSINGERGRANNFRVDMSENNDQNVGVRRRDYVSLVPQSIESIQQFQVIAGAYQAGFGRNSGAIVNAVSKTGGNAVHGSVYGFLTDSRLNARNPFDQLDGPAAGESPSRRAQFGAAAGGPFVRNRSFWFGSLERRRITDRPECHSAVPLAAERSY